MFLPCGGFTSRRHVALLRITFALLLLLASTLGFFVGAASAGEPARLQAQAPGRDTVPGVAAPSPLAALHAGLPEKDFSSRFEAAAHALLGAQYGTSPLGEGQGLDPDPRLRLDRFDCTTYIETVAALALAGQADEVVEVLDGLRYADGEVTFSRRHHLPAAQWLPAQQRHGLVVEATASFASDELPLASLVVQVSPQIWQERTRLRSLRLAAEAVPTGANSVPYLAAAGAAERERVVRRLAELREPLLLNVVRAPRQGMPIVISHQALLLPAGEPGAPPRVLHASSRQGAVVEETLSAFLAQQARRRSWPLLGVNLQRWQAPAPPRP